jgi:hypothetical protein
MNNPVATREETVVRSLDSGSVLTEERVCLQNAEPKELSVRGHSNAPPIRPLYSPVYTSRAFLIKGQGGHFICLRRYGVQRVIVLTLAVLAGLPALAQDAKNTEKPLALMVRRTVHDMGKDALMPPTLSYLLGLTPHPETVAVKQVAAKIRGTDMIGFNVSVKNHGDIVIFRETPTVRTYFLTSPAGVLRKVIESRKPENGEGEFLTTELRPSALKKRFDKERQCWMDVAKNTALSSDCYFAAN